MVKRAVLSGVYATVRSSLLPHILVTAYRPLELLGEPIKTDFISDAREISMTSPKILTLRCFEEKIRFKTLLKEAKGKTRYPAIFCCFDSIKV